VADYTLEKKIYDRQISKQGMSGGPFSKLVQIYFCTSLFPTRDEGIEGRSSEWEHR
jgi:hypothetical protein